MSGRQPLTALGLMSGTSLDGIDAAIVSTDGERVLDFGPTATVAYDAAFRARLRGLLGHDPRAGGPAAEVARDLTLRHADVVRRLLADNGLAAADVDLVGFHGHTVLHRPADGITRQIGDGGLLARETGIAVIDDFRGRDVSAGGEGAPLAPLFHRALGAALEKPLAVLNLGGVANVTWMGGDGPILAFDTGPGNALLDDWVAGAIGRPMDEGGRLARAGTVDSGVLKVLLDHDYFRAAPPKSLDRDDFNLDAVSGLTAEDGAATLTAFTAAAVARAVDVLPAPPLRWLVTGGGRHNPALMAALDHALDGSVEPVEAAGWNGDALEAQAFAFLAVRSLHGLPLSLPTTTGVGEPTTGGTLHRPASRAPLADP